MSKENKWNYWLDDDHRGNECRGKPPQDMKKMDHCGWGIGKPDSFHHFISNEKNTNADKTDEENSQKFELLEYSILFRHSNFF